MKKKLGILTVAFLLLCGCGKGNKGNDEIVGSGVNVEVHIDGIWYEDLYKRGVYFGLDEEKHSAVFEGVSCCLPTECSYEDLRLASVINAIVNLSEYINSENKVDSKSNVISTRTVLTIGRMKIDSITVVKGAGGIEKTTVAFIDKNKFFGEYGNSEDEFYEIEVSEGWSIDKLFSVMRDNEVQLKIISEKIEFEGLTKKDASSLSAEDGVSKSDLARILIEEKESKKFKSCACTTVVWIKTDKLNFNKKVQ